MFYDPSKLDFLRLLTENVDVISEEFIWAKDKIAELKKFMNDENPELFSHVDHWTIETGIHSDILGYDSRNGAWGAFPLFKVGFPIKWYDVEDYFPKTLALIENVPDVFFSSLVRLGPQSGTKKHRHSIPHLVFHLSLLDHDNGGSYITCGEEKIDFSKKGDFCLFDYRVEHSSFNHSDVDRVNLVVDFPISQEFILEPMGKNDRLFSPRFEK